MAVEMPSRLPFSVDTWNSISRRKPFHFLTHAHKDHTQGLERYARSPIYCSQLTANIILQRHPQLDPSIFVPISNNKPTLVGADMDNPFTVTAFDANHCPGSIMLLFEGSWGNMLHTGDCRLTYDCLARIPRPWRTGKKDLDCLYLDCTFASEPRELPTKIEAAEQALQLIWNSKPDARIYFAMDMLGCEFLLRVVSNRAGLKFYVDSSAMPDFYKELMIAEPTLLTDDPNGTRLHLCEGSPRLYNRVKQAFSEADKEGKERPLFIRPSTQWYTFENRYKGLGTGLLSREEVVSSLLRRTVSDRNFHQFPKTNNRKILSFGKTAEKDEYGIWHVCYSMHSSFSELKTAIDILKPKVVIPNSKSCLDAETASILEQLGVWKNRGNGNRMLWNPLGFAEFFDDPPPLFPPSMGSRGGVERKKLDEMESNSGGIDRQKSQKSVEEERESERGNRGSDQQHGDGFKGMEVEDLTSEMQISQSLTSLDLFLISPGNNGRPFRALRPPLPPSPLYMLPCTMSPICGGESGETGCCFGHLEERESMEISEVMTVRSTEEKQKTSVFSETREIVEDTYRQFESGYLREESKVASQRQIRSREHERSSDKMEEVIFPVRQLEEVFDQKKDKAICEKSFFSTWEVRKHSSDVSRDQQETRINTMMETRVDISVYSPRQEKIAQGPMFQGKIETSIEEDHKNALKPKTETDYQDVALAYRYFHVPAPPRFEVSLMELYTSEGE